MKKSLIALALVGAFASAAQAAESNYSIYGRLDLGVTKTNIEGYDAMRLDNGTQSRLGFKGVEDLGNGLKGKFQIEHRFNADTGVTREVSSSSDSRDNFWRAQAWVGLAGEFGEVRLGRQYDALTNTSDQVDPFGGDYVNTGANGKRGLAVKLANGTYDYTGALSYFEGSEGLGLGAPSSRRNNSIVYMSPNMNGFSAEAHLQLTETNYDKSGSTTTYNSDTTRNLLGFRLAYENGPVAASLAYQQYGDTDAAKSASTSVTGYPEDGDQMLLYVGYTLNNATTFGFGYFSDQRDSTVSSQDDMDVKLYTLSATHKIGSGQILAGYQWGESSNPYAAGVTDIVGGKTYSQTDEKYSKFAIGYQHGLSDRTTLYVNLANEKVKNVNFNDGLDSDSATVYGFGVKHNF